MTGVYWQSLQTIWNYMMTVNQKGDFFPLWGTCQGFEQVCVLAASNASVLTGPFDSENYSVPLNLTAAAASSRLFQAAGPTLMNVLATESVTMNNHVYGVTPAAFASNRNLSSLLTMLSLNNDRQGHTFVSTVESPHLPIYATQWHPEKNIFEWNPDEVIPHSPDAVVVTQFTANFLVNNARLSSHHFATLAQEAASLIYNYAPVFTGVVEPDFEQCYFWTLQNAS